MVKPRVALISAGLVLGAIAVVGLTTWAASSYLSNREAEQSTVVSCKSSPGKSHLVIIQNDTAQPADTSGNLCDKLTIKNLDDKLRLISFGVHDRHLEYDGITQRNLGQGESLTVTLNRAGTFLYHDHFQDEVEGTFTVTP